MHPEQESKHNRVLSPVHILHLEDSEPDRELVRLMLRDAEIECEISAVQSRSEFVQSLEHGSWDLILSDFTLPSFDGLEALRIVAKTCPSIPFIFITGTMGEDTAVESLKSGATDYILKQKLGRLGASVRRALNERAERLERQKVETELEKSEERIRFLAYHDSLTGLPNRTLFQDRLAQAIADAFRRDEKVALLFIDLDHFKNINDSLGHSVGDVILTQVAERLLRCARNNDTVARLGGDEFTVIVSAVKDSTDAAIAADLIKTEFMGEFTAQGTSLSTTCSIGISIFPDDGAEGETLLKNADIAMFSAKDNGRNCWRFFTQEMNGRALERLTMESAVRQALAKGQLFLEYQPQLELSTGKVVGAEALARWRHPERGLIPPNTFVPVAENTGEIIPIGEWVLRTACKQARQWQDEGIPPLIIAVNVSAVQLRDASFTATITKVLEDTGLAPQFLELEVTESLLLAREPDIVSRMQMLREMGVKMALDDFGTGYSSFAYVRQFRFDKLKIDGSFVRALVTDANDAGITAAIIGIGSILKMEVIAECVETKAQLDILRSLGCDQIQGYYFSRPLSAVAFADKVRSHYALLPA